MSASAVPPSAARVANYVVAFEASDRGNESIELGVALARLTGAELRICVILPPPSITPGAASINRAAGQAREWLALAEAQIPAGVVATTHLAWAESTAEGLLEIAQRFDSDRIVIGAARTRGGILNRFTIGTVAHALLLSSPIPVALAPQGYKAPADITRVTCLIGTRPGWQSVLDSMLSISEDLSVSLRFVTLIEVDAARAGRFDGTDESSTAHLSNVLHYFEERSDATGTVTTAVGRGASLEAAVDALAWRDDEIAFLGSIRLAQQSKISLGVTVRRILQSLPVPLIVVPLAASGRAERAND